MSTEKIDPHNFLLAEGVLEPCEHHEDLCLSESFSKQWDAKITDLAEKDSDANETDSVLGVQMEGEKFEMEQYGEAWTLVSDSQIIGQWPSQEALLADLGAARVLEKWSGRWSSLAPAQRGQILNGLRLFLE